MGLQQSETRHVEGEHGLSSNWTEARLLGRPPLGGTGGGGSGCGGLSMMFQSWSCNFDWFGNAVISNVDRDKARFSEKTEKFVRQFPRSYYDVRLRTPYVTPYVAPYVTQRCTVNFLVFQKTGL